MANGNQRIVCYGLLVGAFTGGALGCSDNPPPPPPPPPGFAGQPVNNAQPVQPQAVQPQAVQPEGAQQPQQPVAVNAGGAVSLASGFTPDPLVLQGSAGGPVDASTMNPGCVGWVQTQPNHTVMASTAFATLRMLVNGAGQDTTLVVQKPDGSYVCNDDSEGVNPVVQFQTSPGMHRVWVGAYQAGQQYPYSIGFSELGSVTTSSFGAQGGGGAPAAGGGGLDTSGSRSNFGAVTLRPGFMPDPHLTQGTSGTAQGSAIDASEVDPRCRGHVTSTPDHIFVAAADFPQLTIVAKSDGDTTLVIRTPDGSLLCDDDGGGARNPLLRGRFPAGSYSIWVGSYDQGNNYPYRLGFSEVPNFSSDRLN